MNDIITAVALGISLYLLNKVFSLKRTVESLQSQLEKLRQAQQAELEEKFNDKPEEPTEEPQAEPEPEATPQPPEESESEPDTSPTAPSETADEKPEKPQDSGSSETEPAETEQPTPQPVASRSETRVKQPGDSTAIPTGGDEDLIDLENFTGKKLFAWLGGFALFLGMVFLLRFAYQEGWINPSPITKLSGGFLLGTGLILAALYIEKERYQTTIHTFAASGCAILYAVIYGGFRLYGLIPPVPAFFLMCLVTITALLLADRLPSLYVAILGLLGGFITPPLLAVGQDAPFALFTYIGFLNIGIAVVAVRRRWEFLVGTAAIFTVISQFNWFGSHFNTEKALAGSIIFIAYSYFYGALFEVTNWTVEWDPGDWIFFPAVLVPIVSIGYPLGMMDTFALAVQPGFVLTVLFLLNLGPVYLAFNHDRARPWHLLSGLATFVVLWFWTANYLSSTSLYWSLPYYLVFGVLHGGTPVVMQQLRPVNDRYLLGHLYPCLMVFLMLFPIITGTIVSVLVWPFVLFLTLVSFVLATLLSSGFSILVNLLLIFVGFGFWIPHLGQATISLTGLLALVLFFSLLFFAAGLVFTRFDLMEEFDGAEYVGVKTETLSQILPALSALGPFVLVLLIIAEVPLLTPTPVFGLVLLMIVLLFGLVRYQKLDELSPVALLAIGLIVAFWHQNWLASKHNLMISLSWYGGFYGLFLMFPFAFVEEFKDRWLPWFSSALVGPALFYFIYDIVALHWGTTYIGALPALFTLITVLALAYLVKNFPREDSGRRTILALFGGVSLFFLTLIFPLQLSREWLTISWALEGTALIWLYHRIEHSGLTAWGTGLLLIAFGRLALNPDIFTYYPTTEAIIFNWFFYTYGIVSVCLFLAGYWIEGLEAFEPYFDVGESDFKQFTSSLFPALGTILLFYLLNIQIANYFTPVGKQLTFNFSASLAQDMTYSLGWACFAFLLLLAGLYRDEFFARMGSLGLLSVTILKVFFRDLWQLGQLYRVASLFGLAIVLILVSVMYQMFVSDEEARTSET